MPETKEVTPVYQEEEGLDIIELFGVMFGRKLLLAIVTGAITVVGSAASWIYNRSNRTYEADFSFKDTSLNGDSAYFYNGSSFKLADLLTSTKLAEYKESVSELSNIDVESIFDSNGIKEAKWVVTYKDNEGENSDTDAEKVVDETNYRITVKASCFSHDEAKALVKAVVDETFKLQNSYVVKANHRSNLQKYDASTILEDRLQFLQDQYNYIVNLYGTLINKFGDVVADGTNKISEIRNAVVTEFQNTSWSALNNEIKTKYLVSDAGTSREQIEADLENLKLLLQYAKKERDELIEQRNDLVAAGGDKYTLELSAYNSKIIELTEKINNYEMQIELLEKRLAKLDLTSGTEKTEYEEELAKFNTKLNSLKSKLVTDTEKLETIVPNLYKTNQVVYYTTDAIITTNNPISLITFCALSLLAGLVVAIIVNLCLDGKKLTKKYKREHANDTK